MSLPGEKKLKTVASLVVSDTALSVSAFVIRNPDENHDEVYRFLLRRNLRLPGLAYAVDQAGDVYVTGRIPAAGVDAGIPRPAARGGAHRGRRAVQRAARHGLPDLDAQGVGVARLARREPAQPRGVPRTSSRARATPARPTARLTGPLGWLGWRHDGTHAHPAAPRRVRLEPEEPLHRVGRRRPHREGPGRGGARWSADGARPGCCPTSCTPRCCAARSRPPTSRSTRATGTGSRCAAAGASTSGTTARSRASTRRPRARSTATSSSCSGAAVFDTPPPPIEAGSASSTRPATRATRASTCRSPSASRTSSRG